MQTIALDENVGFGRACNRAVSSVSAPVTALLNPDVELIDASLAALAAEALRGDRPARLLAPLVLNADGTRQQTAHPRPVSGPELVGALIPPALRRERRGHGLRRGRPERRGGWAGWWGRRSSRAPRRCDDSGPFDETIFMYGEDLELGLRAAAQGIESWFWPRARVLHSGAHATGPAFGGEPFVRLARARHDVVSRRLGERRGRWDDGAQAVTFASRLVYKRVLARGAQRERRQLAALRGLRAKP